jgi:hypothetical protein
VKGEITGLSDNRTSSAAHVYIDFYPSSLGLSLTTPFDTIADQVLNSFTVSNGQITGALYFAVGQGSYALGINHIGGNYLENPSGPEVFNGNGFAGVTFTAVPAVPETATWAMMLIGFAGLGFAFRQSRRKVSFA